MEGWGKVFFHTMLCSQDIQALSHLAGYIAEHKHISSGGEKNPVRQKVYATQECICNEHRLTRTHFADNNRT